MKERPIPFTGPEVRAILDDRKTMTRRVVKIDRYGRITRGGCAVLIRDGIGLVWRPYGGAPEQPFPRDRIGEFCPYGQPGDRLWVKETFALCESVRDDGNRAPIYRATTALELYRDEDCERRVKWCPSIFMPRWASRIILEVSDVRVDRVQEITEEDAMAEGFADTETLYYNGARAKATAGANFRFLWDSLNAKRGFGWDANPWVWVVTFRRVK
jgi:hypothetical protein